MGDQLLGGMGDDQYHFRSGSPVIVEEINAGTDTIYLVPTESLTFYAPENVESIRIEEDVFLDPASQVNLVGNTLDNVLSGSHRLDGQAGNDMLIGLGDNTFVFGHGYGQDTVQTGTQWYARTGLDQVEFLSDLTPADLVLENHANDLVIKINGTDDQLTVQSYFISPSTSVDQFVFANGTVWGLPEIESRVRTFVGSEASESLFGSINDDTLLGLGGNDQIRASLGNDTLQGGMGNDFLEGFSGNDVYVFGLGDGQDFIDEQGDASDVDTLQLVEGITQADVRLHATPDFGSDAILTINSTTDQVTLGGFFSFDSLRVDRIQFSDGTIWDYSAMLAHTEGVTLVGTEDADFLYGNVTSDTLSGLGGDDSLTGGAGNDMLDGGIGVDSMAGGAGNDVYVVDDTGDMITELTGQGIDTVQSGITYTLGTNLEYLTLIGTAAINGTGNAGNNILTGNIAANVLTGGAGNDTYVVGAGDTVVEQASAGTDTIQSSVSWSLGLNVENLTLTGTSAINGTGNTLNNALIGNSGNNILDGGAGIDATAGGPGDDTYIIDNTGDTITESANEGIDSVKSSVTYTLGANLETLTLTGTTVINGTGNALNNILTGNSAANVLNGGGGADTMAGGAGNDTYVVDHIGDVVNEIFGGGTDLVQSSVTFTLGGDREPESYRYLGNQWHGQCAEQYPRREFWQ
ncbi:MAG: calcium-binding protein [Nitrospiraceae bacterium]